MNGKLADIGVFGLGVMGRNLALNIADHGFAVAVYNRTTSKTKDLMDGEAKGKEIQAGYEVPEFVSLLRKPRAVLMMVSAGKAVDAVIDEIMPHLEDGDILIDAGNSHYVDTDRRAKMLAEHHIKYLGVGVSGGEEGARHGPSIMPGGAKDAYERVQSILEAASAKVDGDPCVTYLGPRSAGHYVKMVHNGIEYGIMQLIAETYDLFKTGLGLSNARLHEIYDAWNKAELQGYLVEITATIFAQKDDKTDNDLIDMILDEAKQKGTGEWTSQDALSLQVPVPNIDIAVTMRNLSGYKMERKAASEKLMGPKPTFEGNRDEFIEQVRHALYASMIMTYAQGMALLREASKTYSYDLDLEAIARIWRGGCIIRSVLLEDFRTAYRNTPDLANLMVDDTLSQRLLKYQGDLRSVAVQAAQMGIPAPGLMAALGYYDAYRRVWLPANLIQAQRDDFGAHRYERIDRQGTFHTEWGTLPTSPVPAEL